MSYLESYSTYRSNLHGATDYDDLNFQIVADIADIARMILIEENRNDVISVLIESYASNKSFDIQDFTYESWVDSITAIIAAGPGGQIYERLQLTDDWKELNEASDSVPTEHDLHIDTNKKFQDAKDEHPTFWNKISNSMKRGMKVGWAKLNDVISLLKNPMQLLKDLKEEFIHAYETLWEFAKKYVQKIGDKMAKKVEKNDKCPIVDKDDMKKEPSWYKDVWAWIPKFVKELVQKLISAATSRIKSDIKESQLPLEVIMSTGRVMSHIPNLNEEDSPTHLQYVHNAAKEDTSFVKWYQEKIEFLSNLVKNATSGMILYVAQAIENLGGPNSLDGYPLSTAVIAISIEIASETMFGVNTWGLDIKKLLLTGAKHLTHFFMAPISWLYYLIQGSKILLTIEHIIHYLHHAQGHGAAAHH